MEGGEPPLRRRKEDKRAPSGLGPGLGPPDAIQGPAVGVLVACAAGAVAVVAAAALASEVLDQPLSVFVEEPAQDGSDAWYAGLVSTAGALLWWSAATVGYLTAWIAWNRRSGVAGFWLGVAALSTMLAIDDLFLVHEFVIPTHLHLPERSVTVAYAVAAGAMVLTHRRYLRTLPWPIGVASLGFFALSVAIDDQNHGGAHYEQLLLFEEGAKLLGITAWTLFFVWSSSSVLLGERAPGIAAERPL